MSLLHHAARWFRTLPGLPRRYRRWLHTRWPAGTVEKLPVVQPDGSTNVKGLYVTGDLTGIPLLKLSADSGARAVDTILADAGFQQARQRDPDSLDLVIIGAGVSGMAAALEAQKHGLRFELLEAQKPFSTVVDFPARKPIYTYPTDMVPAGELSITATIKEELVRELMAQTIEQGIEPRAAHAEFVERRGDQLVVRISDGEDLIARRVIVAIGRSGNFRKLGTPGEDLSKVNHRLHDPMVFAGKHVAVVGGGDSALETAIALCECGAAVTISYRKPEFARPKPANIAMLEALQRDPMAPVSIEEPSSERVTTACGEFRAGRRKPGSIEVLLQSTVEEITPDTIAIRTANGKTAQIPNDQVFTMIGREAPLGFFRQSGVRIRGESRGKEIAWLVAFFLLVCLIYDWKNKGVTDNHDSFLYLGAVAEYLPSIGESLRSTFDDRTTLLGTLVVSMKSRSFYYTLLYSLLIVIFGIRRIRYRQTPYVTLQTLTLMSVQVLPLFLLPELILPWMGYNGWFDAGFMHTTANALFESYGAGPEPEWGHPRAYWRAYGFVLAWPLMVYNIFTPEPIWAWLVIGLLQTFVIIPLIVRKWGKGAYCGWICSCGGLAETMGDRQREKMPHGPLWNRLNMLGQAVLAIAFALLAVRVVGWVIPGGWADRTFVYLLDGNDGEVEYQSYKWLVDVVLGGMLGVGFYFKYSGRLWCRFACPLAALMHIYARFSRFRIFAEKAKCISCNVCTSVCHQGIDVMNFANKGLPMADPQCVRCSACVQGCPTGVLNFGEIGPDGTPMRLDRLQASSTQQHERNADPMTRS